MTGLYVGKVWLYCHARVKKSFLSLPRETGRELEWYCWEAVKKVYPNLGRDNKCVFQLRDRDGSIFYVSFYDFTVTYGKDVEESKPGLKLEQYVNTY